MKIVEIAARVIDFSVILFLKCKFLLKCSLQLFLF